MMINKVLICLDGSKNAELSIPWVRTLAPSAEAIVMRVLSSETDAEGDGYLRDMRTERIPGADILLRRGNAVERILEAAADHNVDLVTITTHGGSPVRRMMFGGTTEKLLHSSDFPLFVVPAWPTITRPSTKIRTIVVPLDGSEISEMILPMVRSIARRHDARVVLAHVLAEGYDTAAHYRDLEAHFEGLVAELDKLWVKAKYVILRGEVPGALMSVAFDEAADLFVMAAHGYGALRRTLLGSYTAPILHESSLPVIVARHAALLKIAAWEGTPVSQKL